MYRITCLLSLLSIIISARADVKPVAHYNFGKAGNVTYAAAPDEIKPCAGSEVLKAVGRPVFYADAPGDKKMKGEGSILFNGNEDGFVLDRPLKNASGNQVLEVWVKPRSVGEKGKTQVVVANGNGKHGYTIAQSGDSWILISGGKEIVRLGEVSKDAWTHLAIRPILSMEKYMRCV